MLPGRTETGLEAGYYIVKDVRFVGGDKQRVIASIFNYGDLSIGTTEYQHTPHGTWQIVRQMEGNPTVRNGTLEVRVNQGLNEPPKLVVANKETSRVLWDPNPQLRNFELGRGERLFVEGYRRAGLEGRAVQAKHL